MIKTNKPFIVFSILVYPFILHEMNFAESQKVKYVILDQVKRRQVQCFKENICPKHYFLNLDDRNTCTLNNIQAL